MSAIASDILFELTVPAFPPTSAWTHTFGGLNYNFWIPSPAIVTKTSSQVGFAQGPAFPSGLVLDEARFQLQANYVTPGSPPGSPLEDFYTLSLKLWVVDPLATKLPLVHSTEFNGTWSGDPGPSGDWGVVIYQPGYGTPTFPWVLTTREGVYDESDPPVLVTRNIDVTMIFSFSQAPTIGAVFKLFLDYATVPMPSDFWTGFINCREDL